MRLFRDPHLTILCYGLLQKDLFKGRSSLENNFFKHDSLMIVVIIVTQGLPSSFPRRLAKYLTFGGGFPQSRNLYVRTRLNKIEAMFERPRENVEVKRSSIMEFAL